MMNKSKFYQVEIDRETSERAGAGGMFQVVQITDEDGNDYTHEVDQGVHYPDLEALAKDLGVSVDHLKIV